jgi:hypothetical protein
MMRGAAVALGIVVLANGLALAGVAYNRSEVVERVELRESEFAPSYGMFSQDSNATRLEWLQGTAMTMPAFSEAQLRAAGLDLPAVQVENPTSMYFPPRQVAVAFELDGPARKVWIDNFFEKVQAGSVPPETRLVAIDVGRDLATVRAAHPDSAHILVLNAIVQPSVSYGLTSRPVWASYITGILPPEIHVSRDMSAALNASRDRDGRARYVLTLAVGRRGEPWIEKIERR